MTYVVTENCIACKYTDCVEVCPVDCFYEGENMLVIHPDECIDCGVCEPECPADAIRPDTEPDTEKWVEFNRKYSEMWPVLVTRRDPLPEAEERDGEPDKLEKLLLRGARRRRLTAGGEMPRPAAWCIVPPDALETFARTPHLQVIRWFDFPRSRFSAMKDVLQVVREQGRDKLA